MLPALVLLLHAVAAAPGTGPSSAMTLASLAMASAPGAGPALPRLQLRVGLGSGPSGAPAADPVGAFSVTEVLAGAAGVLAMDAAALAGGGMVFLGAILVGTLSRGGTDALNQAAVPLGLGAISFVVLDFVLVPLGAVLGAHLVDQGHPGAGIRSVGPPLIAAYLTDALAMGVVVAGVLVQHDVVSPALLGVGAVLHLLGVPLAASLGLHTFQSGQPAMSPGLPPPPLPAPPPPQSRRRQLVVPLIALAF